MQQSPQQYPYSSLLAHLDNTQTGCNLKDLPLKSTLIVNTGHYEEEFHHYLLLSRCSGVLDCTAESKSKTILILQKHILPFRYQEKVQYCQQDLATSLFCSSQQSMSAVAEPWGEWGEMFQTGEKGVVPGTPFDPPPPTYPRLEPPLHIRTFSTYLKGCNCPSSPSDFPLFKTVGFCPPLHRNKGLVSQLTALGYETKNILHKLHRPINSRPTTTL